MDPATISSQREVTAHEYEFVIEPNRSWLHIHWRALWDYRDLLILLVRRDFISKYKQTILGPAWFVLQPLFTTIMFTIVFGRVAKISTDGLPPVLFYMCGLLGWNYFSQNMTSGLAAFTVNAQLFEKVYFPRLIVPLSILTANLCAFALQLLTFLGFFAYYKLFLPQGRDLNPDWHILFAPLLILQAFALSLGVILWMAASTAKYRDLLQVNQFIVQLWMFATPIVYPLSKVPPGIVWLAWLNPMTAIVEGFRLCMLGVGTFSTPLLLTSLLGTLVILFTGIMVFQRVERTMVDTL